MANLTASAEMPPVPVIHLALPKGHMQENVQKLLEEAGVKITLGNNRGYRPSITLEHYDVKLLKPQNILGMLKAGTRDLGFAGGDWAVELKLEHDVVEVFDTGLDPVRIVAAAPDAHILTKGGLGGRKLIVASEYEQITRQWMEKKGIDGSFLRAYGATESLPPEDADIIVDNAATGSTLKANNLEVFDTLMCSTTRLFASKQAWENPAKRQRIETLILLLKSVTDARKRLMVTFNVQTDKLDLMLKNIPAMRTPTVSTLFGEGGYAVQIACESSAVTTLIPKIKSLGGSDIVVTNIKMLVA